MGNPVRWFFDKLREVNNAVWNTSLSQASKRKGILIKYLRTIILAARGYRQDRVQLRAASLTFYTLLSIIPMAAIAFGIAKGFGLEGELEKEISQEFQSHQEVLGWVLSNAKNALQDTKGGYMAGVGVIILFWSVMQLLDHIESSFNHIWQVRQSRLWVRKFTDYLAIMLIAPVFLILSSSITVFISTQLTAYMDQAPILETFKPLIKLLLQLSPYIIWWLVLTLTYIVLPNTKVKFGSAFLAGVIAGTLLQVVQWLYIDLQLGITRLSAIYGSFAAFPLFIVWIQTSWLIVLLGAELAFANQNVLKYEYEADTVNLSLFQRKILTILLLNSIIRNFQTGKEPVSSEVLAANLRIPVRISSEILHELNETGLVVQVVSDQEKQRVYQPGMDINALSVAFVLNKLEKKGIEHPTVLKNAEYEKVAKMLSGYETTMSSPGINTLIKDL
ncbi:MAG: YihY/virulence factor BrkB family protein [Bacteroidetes bacterium]|nr:YihY/virulence factor BrkB family protein [Bacteroidota bacterium]